jgi:hypothetical protein
MITFSYEIAILFSKSTRIINGPSSKIGSACYLHAEIFYFIYVKIQKLYCRFTKSLMMTEKLF